MVKPKLIPVMYKKLKYPTEITANIVEIAGHFDANNKKVNTRYSLHTEYSFMERDFSNEFFKTSGQAIKNAHFKNVPLLWYNDEWVKEFSDYIFHLVGNNPPPDVIEIHPPFRDYTPTMDVFLSRYTVFEDTIMKKYPQTTIALENRDGSHYKRDAFLVRKTDDIVDLLTKVNEFGLKLKVMLDIPAHFSGITNDSKKLPEQYQIEKEYTKLIDYRNQIIGIHIWGRKDRPHIGSLNDLFQNNEGAKILYLQFISNFFDDGMPRLFVPEVFDGYNSFNSIVKDFQSYFSFI
jgi:hypothetical protein